MRKGKFVIGEYKKDGKEYQFIYSNSSYLVLDGVEEEKKEILKTKNMRDAYSFWRNIKAVGEKREKGNTGHTKREGKPEGRQEEKANSKGILQ